MRGRKFFHNRCISWSYRNRGYDARIHKKKVVSRSVFVIKLIEYISGNMMLLYAPRNIIVVRAFIIMMFAYSARKNRAKGPPAYSTLKPDTSSDSPSVRSNGARLVSARVEMNHIINKGHAGMINQMNSWVVISVRSVKDPFVSRTDKMMIARVTSYEIVWATARMAPISAYFEFEAQPDHKMAYTARLDKASKNKMLKFILISGWGIGSGIHIMSAKVSARVGAIMNRVIDDADGCSGSLVNSFTASAIGCRSPNGPTILGPFRSCM